MNKRDDDDCTETSRQDVDWVSLMRDHINKTEMRTEAWAERRAEQEPPS